ncbi:fibrinogen-like YCDxxxxGGGW domain-containing protein [Labilithrix luteola]|nr:fibrinogen-like YCDxxxxGGGW domain-containing protein [Labilithrix luteola]
MGSVVLPFAPACSFRSLDGFADSAESDIQTSDAGGDDGASTQAPEAGDGSSPSASLASCAAIHDARPDLPDGIYSIDPDGDGPTAPVDVFCDMTNDGGGWTLVTERWISLERASKATVVKTTDSRGGIAFQVFMNDDGCGSGNGAGHQVLFDNRPTWSKIRFEAVFAGAVNCWNIFGETEAALGYGPGIIPFVKGVDTIRDARGMGGVAGDDYAGTNVRCDQAPENFWSPDNGLAERSAIVILRRTNANDPAAGLATTANCSGALGAGNTSPTWWAYRNIYVK